MTTNEVVVGLDDSASALAALRWAADYARAAGLSLRAVHVHRETYPPMVWGPGYMAVESGLSEHEMTKRSLETTFSSIDPELGWRFESLEGPIGQVLVEQARHARLLVLGTREHTGVQRIVTGSVSHYCLSHAECPVIAVPAAARPEVERHRTTPASVQAP